MQYHLVVANLLDSQDYNLQLNVLAGQQGLQRPILDSYIQKPGLALAGLHQSIHAKRIQILGRTELGYLASLPQTQRAQALLQLCQQEPPCLIVTSATQVPADMIQLCEEASMPLLHTPLLSGEFIAGLHAYLSVYLAPDLGIHGVLLDVFGVGVLLSGQSGIGKSECALDLILRGHRLVSDDSVMLRQHEREVWGTANLATRYHMEIRGLGILNVRELFGAASVCRYKKVELVVEMIEWQTPNTYDRLGLDEAYESLLGVQIPKIKLPIRPGRNIAAIVEVAARNHLLKLQGHHAARRFQEQFESHLQGNPPR